ncbi:MAG: chemotaxis protein CheW [Gammaproteobacteria bacterium]|nr:chemotaxis protein CheW [Gammaproteobacteria bacterium]
MSRKHQSISQEDQALAGYIAAMFGNAPQVMAAPLRVVEATQPVVEETEAAKLASVRKLLAETVVVAAPVEAPPAKAPAMEIQPVAVPEPAPVVASPAPRAIVEQAPIEELALILPPERAANLIPEWGEKRFQTLFFRVGPLTLAVPLSQLGGIFALEKDRITSLFGKPKWFLGLHPYQGGNMQIVDTARWVMPEKYAEVTAEGLELDYVIRLGDTPWALACTQVHDAVTLEHDDIRWRSSLGRRPWLAGVVVGKMCALLDVDNFIFLLENNQFENRHQGLPVAP